MTGSEVWKPVLGFEGRYSVSNFGRVRRDLKACGTQAGKIFALNANSSKYIQVKLRDESKKQQSFLVHRLVAEAFIGPRPLGMQIDHKDGLRTNNAASNLEYVHPKENVRRAMSMGLINKNGENHPQAKLNNEKVRAIRDLNSQGASSTAIAKKFGVSLSTVSLIVLQKTWKLTVTPKEPEK